MKASEDNDIQMDKVQKSIQILASLNKENELSIQKRKRSQDKLTSELAEKEKALAILDHTVTDKNSSLFSPYENSYQLKEKEELKNRITEIQMLLKKDIEFDEKELVSKKNYELILDCLTEYSDALSKKEKNVSEEKLIGEGILRTQELERQRIARDLHDSTVQNLTNLVHKTELSLKLLDVDPIRTKLELATMVDTIKTTINEMRSIIYNLRPMSIEDLGLLPTIEKYIKHFMLVSGIQVRLDSDINKDFISPAICTTIYRIIQEACNNITKYANASTCIISLTCKNHMIELTIEDNGTGFDVNQVKGNITNDNSGFGLSIMRERALLLNGTFEIKSKRNKGTQIHVIVPYCDNRGN